MTPTTTTPYRVWVLMAHDPVAGWATVPVGVAGTTTDQVAVSWLPLTYITRERWQHRIAQLDDPGALIVSLIDTNGVTLDAIEIPPPAAADLRGAVEAALDELLTAGGPHG